MNIRTAKRRALTHFGRRHAWLQRCARSQARMRAQLARAWPMARWTAQLDAFGFRRLRDTVPRQPKPLLSYGIAIRPMSRDEAIALYGEPR